jgi:SAM-dependent methyltransferase
MVGHGNHTAARTFSNRPGAASPSRRSMTDSLQATDPSESVSPPPRLRVSEKMIRQVAREKGPQRSLIAIAARATFYDWVLRKLRRIDFRQSHNASACEAYEAMELDDFIAINSRQAWANWRTIPRNLHERLIDRPVFAIDLCSGVGDSTAVLAHYCAPGSRILGYEFNQRFVDHARQREYLDRDNRIASVEFLRQNVLEPFLDQHGDRIADGSVDLINACGAVGCHFDFAATQTLARECRRVLRSGGLSLIDSGRGGTEADELVRAFQAEGFTEVNRTKSCLVDVGEQLCLQKR